MQMEERGSHVVMWRQRLLNRGYPGQRGKSPELGQAWYRRGRERSGWPECRCYEMR